jgi:hypothetical protein
LAADAGAGKQQTANLVQSLRTRITQDAELENTKGVISGDLEIDEHGVRTTHISDSNPNFEKPKFKGLPPPYWLLYVRVIGLKRRGGGKIYIKFLPYKLVRPKGKPPPLSSAELVSCGILRRCGKGSVVFSDGAKAYHAIITRTQRGKLKTRQVAHNRLEFTKKCSTGKGHSKVAGTQAIDGTWKQLNRHVPHPLKTKMDKKVNPLLKQYVMSWVWRHNHKIGDGFGLVGDLFK